MQTVESSLQREQQSSPFHICKTADIGTCLGPFSEFRSCAVGENCFNGLKASQNDLQSPSKIRWKQVNTNLCPTAPRSGRLSTCNLSGGWGKTCSRIPAGTRTDDSPTAHSSLATRRSKGAAFLLPTDATTAAKNAQLMRQTPAFAGSISLPRGSHEAM